MCQQGSGASGTALPASDSTGEERIDGEVGRTESAAFSGGGKPDAAPAPAPAPPGVDEVNMGSGVVKDGDGAGGVGGCGTA
eukprot:3965419-Pleurochrysis_carterae.AAC.1